MLTKWWWRYNSNPDQLWAKVILSIHNNNSNLLIPLKKTIPGVWNDIGKMDSVLAKAGLYINQNLIKENGAWKWRSSVEESFSVKQVRLDLENVRQPTPVVDPKLVWNSWAPAKGNILLWRALLGRVASKEGLARRGWPFMMWAALGASWRLKVLIIFFLIACGLKVFGGMSWLGSVFVSRLIVRRFRS
ncbi:hypothetical protein HanIR_Chr11g0547521 [Helianthus annuus]|nr:hypothetical protein HanIR_Chr11g0547521 [Helianthus annuus]